METNTKNFCRDLTAEERKQIKASGELAGIYYSTPLLAWKASKTDNEIRFYEVWNNALVETPFSHYVAKMDGIVIVVATATGLERLYFFEEGEYPAALDFYNKMQVALEKSNNL